MHTHAHTHTLGLEVAVMPPPPPLVSVLHYTLADRLLSAVPAVAGGQRQPTPATNANQRQPPTPATNANHQRQPTPTRRTRRWTSWPRSRSPVPTLRGPLAAQ